MPEFVWMGNWKEFALNLPHVDMLWDPLVPAYGTTLIHGPGGCGKSAVVWGLMNAMQDGEHYLGLNVARANCLLISFDMSKFAHNERWGTKFTPRFDICYENKLDATNPAFKMTQLYGEVQKVVKERAIKLVVIDALSGLILGHKASDDDTATAVMAALDVWLPETAKLLIHHDRKTRYGGDGKPLEPTSNDFLGSAMWRNNAISQVHMWKLGEHVSALTHEKSQVSCQHDEQLKLYMDMHGEVELWNQKRADDVIQKFYVGIEELGLQDTPATRQVEALAAHYGVGVATIYRWKKIAKQEAK
jgi:RecA-family ATPase